MGVNSVYLSFQTSYYNEIPAITSWLGLNLYDGAIGNTVRYIQKFFSQLAQVLSLEQVISVTSGSTSSSILLSPCGVPRGSVLGPILFTIYVSSITRIVSSHGVNQQHYSDDTQLFLFLFPASLSSSLCSLQRCVSSLHSWFLHSGLVLNPTKTETICFGTNTRLKSLSNLTCIEVAGTSVPLANQVKLLGVTFDSHLNFDEHISNVCSSSYFHISALCHIRLYLDLETSKTFACMCYCWFQTGLCQFSSNQHFFAQYPTSSARSKFLGAS